MAAMQFLGGPGNRTCQLCGRNEASHFCNCLTPPTLFCLDCCGHHNAKYPRIVHNAIPIVALNQNPDEYMRRSEALKKGAAELRRNLELIDQFSRDFDNMMQACISYLAEYRSNWLQNLQKERETLYAVIEAAVGETSDCLEQGLEPGGQLAQALWNLQPEQLQMVSYAINSPDLSTLCQSWVFYQNQLQTLCQYFAPKGPRDYFVAIHYNNVELYDLQSQLSSWYTLPINFGEGGSYLALDRNALLCIGAYPETTAVYELGLPSLQLTSLPPLLSPRSAAGVAKVASIVYVFGGSHTLTKSCEKYNMRERRWLPMGDMHEKRAYFTPCVVGNLIYLPSLTPDPKENIIKSEFFIVVESFDPKRETFTPLPVSYDGPFIFFKSVAFVTKGELCILAENKLMLRWKIESESEFRHSVTDRGSCSTQPPLIMESEVLIANAETGRMEKFSLQSYTFI